MICYRLEERFWKGRRKGKKVKSQRLDNKDNNKILKRTLLVPVGTKQAGKITSLHQCTPMRSDGGESGLRGRGGTGGADITKDGVGDVS